jgi:hypothetical protein
MSETKPPAENTLVVQGLKVEGLTFAGDWTTDKARVGEHSELICPCCGGNNLHHAGVAVFERQHEDGPLQTALIHNMAQPLPENPSARRDGLVIEFWCESSCGRMRLAISQHKGCTYFNWL